MGDEPFDPTKENLPAVWRRADGTYSSDEADELVEDSDGFPVCPSCHRGFMGRVIDHAGDCPLRPVSPT